MPDPAKIPVSMPLSTPEPMNMEMPKTRKRLIVSGNVQDVGYRALVKRKARRLGLLGFSRNIPDETVEIVCEGEPGALTEFMKSIDVKGDPTDSFSLHVTAIKETPPAPEGELTVFYTDYGRKLTEIERQTFDRDEIMVLRAGTLNTNVGVVGQKVDGVGEAIRGVGQKVDGVGKDVRGVGSAVHDMHTDMNKRFDHMADRYDMIALSLKEAIVHMDQNAEKTDKAIEKSRKETILEVRKSHKETAKILSESRKEVAASNRELARAVNFMIRKMSAKAPTPKKVKPKNRRTTK